MAGAHPRPPPRPPRPPSRDGYPPSRSRPPRPPAGPARERLSRGARPTAFPTLPASIRAAPARPAHAAWCPGLGRAVLRKLPSDEPYTVKTLNGAYYVGQLLAWSTLSRDVDPNSASGTKAGRQGRGDAPAAVVPPCPPPLTVLPLLLLLLIFHLHLRRQRASVLKGGRGFRGEGRGFRGEGRGFRGEG
eukprot:4243340-Pyramimonas_sp.AAC.1